MPPTFGEPRRISWRQLFAVFGGLGSSPSIHSCGEVHIPFENRGIRGISGNFGEFRGISGDFGEFRGEPILGVFGHFGEILAKNLSFGVKFQKCRNTVSCGFDLRSKPSRRWRRTRSSTQNLWTSQPGQNLVFLHFWRNRQPDRAKSLPGSQCTVLRVCLPHPDCHRSPL